MEKGASAFLTWSLLLVVVVSIDQRKYHASQYTHIGAPINRYDISHDGRVIFFTDTNFHLHRVVNDGSNLIHTLDIDCSTFSIHNGRVMQVNENGTQAFIAGLNSCTSLEFNDTNYSVKWTLNYPNKGAVPWPDFENIYIQNTTSPYSVDIFKFNGTDMVFAQSIWKGASFYSKRGSLNPKSLYFFTIVTPAVLRIIMEVNGVFQ